MGINQTELERLCLDLKSKIQPGKGDGPEALGEIVTCSGEKALSGKKLGINNVRWAVLAATGLADEKKLLRSDITIHQMTSDTTPHLPQ